MRIAMRIAVVDRGRGVARGNTVAASAGPQLRMDVVVWRDGVSNSPRARCVMDA